MQTIPPIPWKAVRIGSVVVLCLSVVVGIIGLVVVKHFEKPVTTVTTPAKETVHYHAGFQIYVDDVLQDFSGMEYMELAPCTPESVPENATVHLHNGVGDVVHVHHADMTWQNLIDYLQDRQQFAPTNLAEKGVVGYVNGKKVDDILAYPITAYDSAIIYIGDDIGNTKKELKNAVTVQHIKDAEAQKENCGL